MSEGSSDVATLLRATLGESKLNNVRCAVSVIEGKDRGKTFEFDRSRPSRVLVGQSPACDLELTDPQVSRRHFSLDLEEKGIHLVDLGSTNGTFVDGLRVGDAYLRGGEVVRVGDTSIAVAPLAASEPFVLPSALRFGRMVGMSPEMRRLYPLLERLAKTQLPIVIEGETGTGKELLAESLHDESPRKKSAFVVFDCTAFAPSLVESQLFGHEKGSFTGAVDQRIGVFEQAHGGTLFIDELGELDLTLQPKLLRAVERGEIQRVGSNHWTPVDVRLIAATRRSLDKEVQEGRFRDDLFYRLALGRVELPPLRDRTGDVLVLARHFWRALGGDDRPMPEVLLMRLARYDWPGNVRELANAVARAYALGDLDEEPPRRRLRERSSEAEATEPVSEATESDDEIARVLELDLPLPRARGLVVDAFERRYVERILARYDGNVVRAAAASGIARRYFQLLRARSRK